MCEDPGIGTSESTAPATRRAPHRFVREEDLSALDSSGDDDLRLNYDAVHHRIRQRISRYASSFSGGLTLEDRQDVVSEAVVAFQEALIGGARSVKVLNTVIRRAIERARKKLQRESGRRRSDKELDPRRRYGNEPDLESRLIFKDRLVKLVAAIDWLLRQCIRRLSDRQRSILIYCYGLDALGSIPPGAEPDFPSKGAEKKALWLARKKLSYELEKALESESARRKLRPDVRSDALRFVRGGNLTDLP